MKKTAAYPYMQKVGVLTVLLLIIFLAGGCSRTKQVNEIAPAEGFRILGYLFSDHHWEQDLDSVNLLQITDINFAFLQPDSTGKLKEEPDFSNIVKSLHQKNIRVFFSIGGGDPPAHLESLIRPGKREFFIRQIVLYSEKYGFDGVDADLENELINDDYPGFIAELSTALQTKGKLVTAAVASWNADKFHDSTLNRFDFINIMSYDKTGPWNNSKPGQHSPYQMAVDDFNYFTIKRGIPGKKLLIGLPFYGYGFGGNAPASLAYGNIIRRYPGAENRDSLAIDGGNVFYNGRETIRRKVQFAKNNNAAGVMIWQLRQDSRGEQSLLNVVFQSARGK